MTKQLTDKKTAQHSDNDASLDSDLTFIYAQLAYAKSKQGKSAKRKSKSKKWFRGGKK